MDNTSHFTIKYHIATHLTSTNSTGWLNSTALKGDFPGFDLVKNVIDTSEKHFCGTFTLIQILKKYH